MKTLEAHPSFQMKAEELLKGITGIYIKVNPIPKNGNIIKIPLEPAVLVENEWVHSYVDEIKVIFPIGEKPYLMVFDDENYPHFFNFEGNTEDLQSLIHNQ